MLCSGKSGSSLNPRSYFWDSVLQTGNPRIQGCDAIEYSTRHGEPHIYWTLTSVVYDFINVITMNR